MQKSAVLVGKGKPLEVQETAIPKPGPGQILVKIHSAAFNPVDWKIQKTGRFFETFPRVIGGDIAGTVEDVGPNVTRFKKGDKVFSFVPYLGSQEPTTALGGFQQYSLTAAEGATGLVPDGVSLDAASTVPLAFSTAADGLYNFLHLDKPSAGGKSSEPVLVWGGASSVGQFAIQLLKNAGYKVIATASKSGHSDLKSLGADVVLDYHDSDVVKQIGKAADGKLKIAYDSISNEHTIPSVLKSLPEGGKAAFTQLTPETAKVDCPSNIEYVRVFAGTLQAQHKDLGQELFDWASKALGDGSLKGNPVKVREGGVEAVQDTLDLYQKEGIQNAKFVINP